MKIIFSLVVLTLLIGGIGFYRAEKHRLRREAEINLSAIAHLKANQIAAWRADQVQEGDELIADPFFVKCMAQVIADPKSHTEALEDAILRLRAIQKHHHYSDIQLVQALIVAMLLGLMVAAIALVIVASQWSQTGAEKALRENEKMLKLSQSVAKLGHYQLDTVEMVWTRSENLEVVFGIPSDYPGVVESWKALIHPEDKETMSAYLQECMQQKHASFKREYRIVRPSDGAVRWVLGLGEFRFNEAGVLLEMFGTIQDITEQKQLEAKLQQTQRMESLGSLAAGMAHDLNNILTPINLFADLLREEAEPATRESLIRSIEQCAKRGADVVSQVLIFARGSKGDRKILQLNDLVKDMERVICETFPKNIAAVRSIPAGLWSVKADRTQIHQVLLNLCINARDAMPEGGIITILAANETIDEHFASMVPDAEAGEYAMVSISDSGSGIPRDIHKKIFDPFFTTKELGKGTGLGLSTAIGIVRSHGGFITLESEEGKGSTFKVFLPRELKGEEAPTPEGSLATQIGEGSTILVVDDEVLIVIATSMMLKKSGYNVLTSADGTEALALYKANATRIDLVLTDVMMPRMDGVELARALKKINPEVKIIASTGQASEILQADLQALGVHLILRKPYDIKQLLAALQSAFQITFANG